MKKWIAKMMLAMVFVTMLGAGARVLADDVIYNPDSKIKTFRHDVRSCGCFYHVIEGFVVDLFK